MRLRAWRKGQKLTIKQAAEIFELSVGGVSGIERGHWYPTVHAVLRIEGATGGNVTLADHFETWCVANRVIRRTLEARGRSRFRAFQKPETKQTKVNNGRSIERRDGRQDRPQSEESREGKGTEG